MSANPAEDELLKALDFDLECQNRKCSAKDTVAVAFVRVQMCQENGCTRSVIHLFACRQCVRFYKQYGGSCTVCQKHIPGSYVSVVRWLKEE